MQNKTITIWLMFITGVFFSQSLISQQQQDPQQDTQHDPAIVLAFQGESVLTQTELDAAFSRIPQKHRLAFIRDGEKVNMMIGTLMLNKLLAAQAYKDQLDKDPQIQERLQLALEQELALAWKDHMLSNPPDADFDAIAYEFYISDPGAFVTPESIDVSHILIKSESRSDEQARELAGSVRARLLEDPEQFEALVEEFSEDPGKYNNNGRYPAVERGQMVPSFEKAAFAMNQPGEFSELIKSSFGYHIIRFNGRTDARQLEFDKVKQGLLQRARDDHAKKYRDSLMTELVRDPLLIPDGALEIMIRRHFGQNLELAPDFQGRERSRSE